MGPIHISNVAPGIIAIRLSKRKDITRVAIVAKSQTGNVMASIAGMVLFSGFTIPP
jgi:hypothetical protein